MGSLEENHRHPVELSSTTTSARKDVNFLPFTDEAREGGELHRNMMTGGRLNEEEPRNEVWFKCCIKEFWVVDDATFKNKLWRMFGTKITNS